MYTEGMMMRFLFYLIPSMFDYVLYGIFFIVGYRFAESGLTTLVASAPMAVWGIVYALSSPLIGRLTTEKNARFLVFVSGLGTAAVSILFLISSWIFVQLGLIVVMGILSACYCTPFQICAGNSQTGRSPERAAALYTFSWSLGTAAGTFGFGCLPETAGFTVNALIGLAIAGVIFWGRAEKKPGRKEKAANEAEDIPDRMVPVWLFGGTAAFCMAVAGALLPVYGVELKCGVLISGMVLALLRFTQAVTALVLIYFRKYMFGRGILFFETLTGILGLSCWSFKAGAWLLFAGAVLFGICGGCFYFNFVFHALAHREKSGKYIGVNEFLLGLTGIIGPAAGGIAAQYCGGAAVFGALAFLLLLGGAAAISNPQFRRIKQVSV